LRPDAAFDPRLQTLSKKDKPPYWPSKYENQKNSNGDFSLGGISLVCRNLSTYYANETSNGKFNFQHFKSQADISALPIDKFDEIKFLADPLVSKVVGDSRDFGEWIRVQFNNLQGLSSQGSVRGSALVETCNHALGVAFEIKTLENGVKRYVITVFDPNDTQTHCRMAVNSLQRLAGLQLRDFCRPDLFDDYAEGQTSVLYATKIPQTRMKQSEFVRAQHLRRELSSQKTREARLFLAMRNDVPDEIHRLGSVWGDWRAETLLGRQPGGTTALYIAMQQNTARSIDAYAGLLKKAPMLHDALWKKILRAASDDGTPGLYIGLQEGSADAIDRYGDLLLQSGIRDKRFIEHLLCARQASGASGLCKALWNGHAKAIDAYRILLEKMNRVAPDAVKEVLRQVLLAKGSDGVPALFVALQDNKADAIDAYARLLGFAASAHPEVVRGVREQILDARRPSDDLAGLTCAAWRDCGAAIEAYGRMAKTLVDNDDELLRYLIGRRSSTGASALYLALNCNRAASVAAYSKLLDAFTLSSDSKIELLRADKASGELGISPCKSKQNMQALDAYRMLLGKHGAGLTGLESIIAVANA
jgi:hypothetical protein